MLEMERRKFVKGSAIVGASLVSPKIVDATSGLVENRHRRSLYRLLETQRETVGTLPILRGFAGDQTDFVSPYVLFDEFGPVQVDAGSDPLRVDAHPHAGVTPTTYFLAGSGHHKDSLDHDFQIAKGDLMLFRSGRGAIHMEETGRQLYDSGGNYHGFQIWLNIPAKHKFTEPKTLIQSGSAMEQIKGPGYHVRVVLGSLREAKSSVETLTPAFYYHVTLDAQTKMTIPVHPLHNAFLYVVSGSIEIANGVSVGAKQIALLQRDGAEIDMFAHSESQILVLGGQPLKERVFSYGPFVMNNEEQIRRCIAAYHSGAMGDPDRVNR